MVITTTANSHTDSPTIYADQTIYVVFSSTNSSSVNIPNSFNSRLLVDGVVRTFWTWPNGLQPYYYTTLNSFYAVGQLSAGSHNFRIELDSSANVTESNETDNVIARTITVLARSAPTITTAPQGKVIASGQTAALTVVATSNETLSYQWYRGSSPDTSNPIVGATSATYTTPTLSSTTTYWVRVTASSGLFTNSDSAVVTIGVPPTITTQPRGSGIVSGQLVSLAVVVAGTNPLSYQWYRGMSGDAANPIAGATSATYSTYTQNVTTNYWVRAANGIGVVDSTTATVSVVDAPVGLVGYWSLDGHANDFSSYANHGAARGGYGFVAGRVGQAGRFDAAGTKYVEVAHQSQYALGDSFSIVFWIQQTAPTMGRVLQKYLAAQDTGNSWEILVEATGRLMFSNPPNRSVTSYGRLGVGSWRHCAFVYDRTAGRMKIYLNGSVDLSQSITLGRLDTTSALMFMLDQQNSSLSATGLLDEVRIYNRVLTDTEIADLAGGATSPIPIIASPPLSQTAAVGSNVTLSATVLGQGPLTYQWRRNDTVLPGATGTSLLLYNLTGNNAGSYTITATNSEGSVTSEAARVELLPAILVQPINQITALGQTVTFTVEADGSAPLSYQWSKGDQPVAGATSATLTVTKVGAGDLGNYGVTVSNSVGRVTSEPVNLSLAVGIVSQPASIAAPLGKSATFTVQAVGVPPLTYQWQFQGTAIDGATSASYTIPAVAAAQEGTYTVVVGSAAATITSLPATLTISLPPEITLQPASRVAIAGQTVVFSVGVTGSAPFTYQWSVNGATVPGATNATLTLSNVQAVNAASYRVAVSNIAANGVLSNIATLVVQVPPTAQINPGNQTVQIGSSASFSVAATGTAPLTYQWRKNAAPIAGATSSVLSFSSVSPLDAGSYDVVVSNMAGTAASQRATLTVTTGSGTQRMGNVSTRVAVGTGANVLITGVVLQGSGTRSFLARAIGPGLLSLGVSGVLSDPVLRVLTPSGAVVGSNDNWNSGLVNAFAAVGAFGLATGSRDAALIVELAAGAYNFEVSGVGGASGIALVELYELP